MGKVRDGKVVPKRYYRKITRLGGGFIPERGLAPDALERTLFALQEVIEILKSERIEKMRAVGTEALRMACNGSLFVDRVYSETGIPLEIIDGAEEARLSAMGVLGALVPRPKRCLLFDVGGGSAEFILWDEERMLFHRSYPLGVVHLCEKYPSAAQQRKRIGEILKGFIADLNAEGFGGTARAPGCLLVGTAGTVTNLAALRLGMTEYDWQRVNNFVLSLEDLKPMLGRLEGLSVEEREALPGMEKGRGDLIVPGLRAVLAIMEMLGKEKLTVSDFGLLEGILLEMGERKPWQVKHGV
jgi:exopolyphosphatase / guanosine-5'-triphosphate,3'-diphosphate pyrophosphatase